MCQKGRKYQRLKQTRLVYLYDSSIMWLQCQIATSKELLTGSAAFPFKILLVAVLVPELLLYKL